MFILIRVLAAASYGVIAGSSLAAAADGSCGKNATSDLNDCYEFNGLVRYAPCTGCLDTVLTGLEAKSLLDGCSNFQSEFCYGLNGCGNALDCTAEGSCQSEWEAYLACIPPSATNGDEALVCRAPDSCDYDPEATDSSAITAAPASAAGMICATSAFGWLLWALMN